MKCLRPTARRAARVTGLLALGALSLAAAGCRTFNFTEEDLEQDRKLLAERSGDRAWGVGANFHPSMGKINLGGLNCPNLGGGVCPGK